MQLCLLCWNYIMSNIHHRHYPCYLSTPLRVTRNQQEMSKGTKISHMHISNTQTHYNHLCMLMCFRNVPVKTIASAFIVVVLLPRLFLESRLKNFSARKSLTRSLLQYHTHACLQTHDDMKFSPNLKVFDQLNNHRLFRTEQLVSQKN